jgi:hypothetical protein
LLLTLISFPFSYPTTDTDGDQHQLQQPTRANHAVFDPIFIQYIVISQAQTKMKKAVGTFEVPYAMLDSGAQTYAMGTTTATLV